MQKTVQVVIEIPKELVTDIKDDCGMSMEALPIIVNAICNGTVLEPHGRCVDADAYKKNLKWNENVDAAPTILEAWGNEE